MRAICLSMLLGLAVSAGAQEYPMKPVRVVDPFSPGGSTDVLARIVGARLQERLGQPFIVDNRAGGGGHIGADFVAKAPPNGYTLLVAGVPHAIGMTLYRKLPYDMAKDLAPITQIATFPSLIVVHPSVPVKTMKELIALARARPGELNFGANTGSPNHLAIELVNTMAGVTIQRARLYFAATTLPKSRSRNASAALDSHRARSRTRAAVRRTGISRKARARHRSVLCRRGH